MPTGRSPARPEERPIPYELAGQVPVARFPEAAVRGLAHETLVALGADEHEARINADGLVTASLWWHPGQGQGLEKLFRYARRVKNGGIVPRADMRRVRDHPSSALLDAGKGLGYVAAHRAMALAIEKATGRGIALVGVRNSNHFGIAGYHALQAARAGLIGIAQTNAGAEMAPWGSATPVLGTNPWGIAIPRGEGHDPIVLDMALTQSGKGMMAWLTRAGSPMPRSWALTPDGASTDDPRAAAAGPLLPIGDYKGYGLSLVTDVLCGVMTGALFGTEVFQDDTHFDVGHAMTAIDPGCFIGRERFEARVETLVDQVLSAPPIDPARPVVLPGQVEQERARLRIERGVPVAAATVEKLDALAAELGVVPLGRRAEGYTRPANDPSPSTTTSPSPRGLGGLREPNPLNPSDPS